MRTPHAVRFRLKKLPDGWGRWRACMIVIEPGQVTVQRQDGDLPVVVQCAASDLRWFGRPKHYHPGTNHILLHCCIESQWHVLELKMSRYHMQHVVRALKQIATEAQVTAYRRRPPHVHFGPMQVAPAMQDIHGAWTLERAIRLYLMPTFVVLFNDTGVLREIAVADLQRIQAAKRLDVPAADGLVRFQVEGEPFAFSTRQYQKLADAMGEAARRTLEDPVMQKRKKKDDDD